jgi:hypothetical protein
MGTVFIVGIICLYILRLVKSETRIFFFCTVLGVVNIAVRKCFLDTNTHYIYIVDVCVRNIVDVCILRQWCIACRPHLQNTPGCRNSDEKRSPLQQNLSDKIHVEHTVVYSQLIQLEV